MIDSPELWTGPCTWAEIETGRAKPVLTVETERATYRANDFTQAMKMWRDSGDDSQVLDVTRCG